MTNQNSSRANPGFWLEILRNGQLAWRLMHDPRVATITKIMVPALVAAYIISPVDLIPDFIPVLGQLDDLAILALAVKLFISLAPPAVVAEHQAQMNGPDSSNSPIGSPANSSTNSQGTGETVDATYRVVK